MAASRTTGVTFINNLNLKLRLTSKSILHGEYLTKPPDVIEPGKTVKWQTASYGIFTGVEGHAVYEFTHNERNCEINIHWDNPYVGKNSYSCKVNDSNYQISCSSKGHYESFVTYTFFKKILRPLRHTKTHDFWNDSYPTSFEDASSSAHLVSYMDELFCFCKSEVTLDVSDIFYITKKHKSSSWSIPKAIKALGNDNSGLCAVLHDDKILIACRDYESKIKLITYEKGVFSEVIYHDLKIRSSGDLSLCIFLDKIHLFFRDADESFIWHFLLEEKNNSYKNLGRVIYWPGSPFRQVVYTSVSPKTIVYKELLYLTYATLDKYVWNYVIFNGEKWSYPIRFTKINYSYPPGLAIHRGLLKVAFVGSTHFRDDRVSDRIIYQYSYDENSWSLPMPSSYILAGDNIATTSYNDVLLAMYPAKEDSGITNDTVDPHNEL